MSKTVFKGEVYLADLPYLENSSIQSGERPVIIFCNWQAGKYSPVVQYIPVTSEDKKYLPVHVKLSTDIFRKSSTALPEQLGCIDKNRLKRKIGVLSSDDMMKINKACMMQQELDEREYLQYNRNLCYA